MVYRPKQNDRINKNKKTKKYFPYNRTMRPKMTIRQLQLSIEISRTFQLCNNSVVWSFLFVLLSFYLIIWSFFGHPVFYLFGPLDWVYGTSSTVMKFIFVIPCSQNKTNNMCCQASQYQTQKTLFVYISEKRVKRMDRKESTEY